MIKVILAIEEVITATIKIIYPTKKEILATDEVITASLKNKSIVKVGLFVAKITFVMAENFFETGFGHFFSDHDDFVVAEVTF